MPLISLLIYLIIFAIGAYVVYWLCIKFAFPQPVLWICGAVLLILLLLFLASQFGLNTGSLNLPMRR